jgi:hypothetical protein
MTEEKKAKEVKQAPVEATERTEEKAGGKAVEQVPDIQINLNAQTAMTIKMQEFDKKISEAELMVAKLKCEKASYIYDTNVQQIVFSHKEQMVKAQIEEETKKKMEEANKGK